MTNRNDDDFNFDDDLFGSDSGGAGESDFSFDDPGLDDLGGIGEDEFSFEDGGGGTNRTFVILAFLIILLFIAGVVAIIYFALNRGPTEIDVTRTAIAQFNSTQQAFLAETGTASAWTRARRRRLR